MFEYYPLCGTMFTEGVVSAGKVIQRASPGSVLSAGAGPMEPVC